MAVAAEAVAAEAVAGSATAAAATETVRQKAKVAAVERRASARALTLARSRGSEAAEGLRWPIMATISGCRHLKVTLNAKLYIYVNSTT